MKLKKIQYPGITLAVLLSLSIIEMPVISVAQNCGQYTTSITYDTTFTSNVTSSGNAGNHSTFYFTIPKFPVSAQTLYAVAIHSTISVSGSVDVQNTSGNTVIPSVKLYRSDDAYSDPTGDVNNIALSLPFNSSSLAAGGTMTLVSPNAFRDYNMLNDSVNTADISLNDYIGDGTVDITYSAVSTPLVSNNVIVLSSTISDVIHFSVTYYYCTPGTLASNLLTFTANRRGQNLITLDWFKNDEQSGRQYTVEMAPTGREYSPIGVTHANSSGGNAAYSHDYIIQPLDKGSLNFRLKLTNPDGTITYSPVRIITLDNAALPVSQQGISIYPNPAKDFININLPWLSAIWQIDILSINGSLVQRYYCYNTNLGRVNFTRQLASATYFVRAMDVTTSKTFTGKIIVR